jgi:hypothetical protein
VIGGLRKLHNEELQNLYYSAITFRIIKSRRMRWTGHVARMGPREMHVGFWWEQKQRDHCDDRKVAEAQAEVDLCPTVSRPVCPGVRRPSGTCDHFFFPLEISFRQLRVCYFIAPSLTRGRVCNLLVQVLLGLARAVTLGSVSE